MQTKSPTPIVTWARSLEQVVDLAATPAKVFCWVDDPRNTGMHMSQPSLAMLGASLRVERQSASMTGVGTTYRSWGRVLGLPVDFTTTVTSWTREREKTWRTIGEPALIVLGHFEMHFSVAPAVPGTRLRLAIKYNLPATLFGRVIGRILAAPYARWCLRRIANDAQAAFNAPSRAGQATS
jgi:hypothetical protein